MNTGRNLPMKQLEEQGPDGAIWIIEDEEDGSGGRLLKLTPKIQ